ncbi:hypothetical protein SCHPADRAFT_689073 [Schizopora paradoxa]|uniref:Uncharacterized protein n=1 Tax=Schizopora paradoxa TaxID=27342 RepID=A0A0H2R3Y4_9AGAM|nr:hypothetical protein SCHPADRAFT_689073 [Schizopora paradoxa]
MAESDDGVEMVQGGRRIVVQRKVFFRLRCVARRQCVLVWKKASFVIGEKPYRSTRRRLLGLSSPVFTLRSPFNTISDPKTLHPRDRSHRTAYIIYCTSHSPPNFELADIIHDTISEPAALLPPTEPEPQSFLNRNATTRGSDDTTRIVSIGRSSSMKEVRRKRIWFRANRRTPHQGENLEDEIVRQISIHSLTHNQPSHFLSSSIRPFSL